MPSTSEETAAATSASSQAGDGAGGMIPAQLAVLVPSYDPSKDDLTIYQQKVELLTATWPEGRLIELATRLILNTTGTAFQKLQLNQKDILVNNRKGIEKIIQLLGGSWGRIPLEQKFEAAEKAIYRCQQKADEANDSYLARADVLWQELLNKGMELSELQAYIVLRGSVLSAEDKKKVILDSEVNGAGSLKVDRVQAAIRMLGAGFFQEMTSGRKANRLKTYDNTILMAEEEDEDPNCLVSEAMPDEEDLLDQLLQEGDEDAIMVAEFENTANEVLQEDAGLSSVFSAYTEARRKLSEKFRFRGFFPVTKGKGKPGGKGSWKGKNNRFQGRDRDRKPLNQRILRSQCRRCLQFGHWKDECPLKQSDGAASTGGSAPPSSSFAGSTITSVPESLPLEFLQLQEFAGSPIDAPDGLQEPFINCLVCHKGLNNLSKIDHVRDIFVGVVKKTPSIAEAIHSLRSRRRISKPCEFREAKPLDDRSCDVASSVCNAEALSVAAQLGPSFGILDTGATKTVIGSQLISSLINSLSPYIRRRVSRCPCNVVFRFGNLSTLESEQALVIPIGRLFLKVAIVPGSTPFLLSNTLMRALKAMIDTKSQMLHSPILKKSLPLNLTSKGLYLIDVNQLALLAEAVAEGSVKETFTNVEVESKSEKSAEECVSKEVSQPIITGSKSSSDHHHECSQVSVTRTGRCTNSFSSSDHREIVDSPISSRRHHAFSSRSPEEDSRASERPTGGSSGILPSATGGNGGGLWVHPCRSNVLGDVGKPPILDSLVRPALQQEHQTFSSSDDPFHSVQDRTSRTDWRQGASDGWRESEAGSQEQVSGLHETDVQGRDYTKQVDSSRRDGRARRELGRFESRADGSSESDRDPAAARGSSEPYAAHGECIADYSASSATTGSTGEVNRSPEWHWLHAGDPDSDERCYLESSTELPKDDRITESERNRFHRLVNQYSKELQSIIQDNKNSRSVSKTLLFEVFCSNHSQLTHQCQQLSCIAERFGYAQGDLHTSEGRHTLFQELVTKLPRHLWYSPMCGPWCAFSALNASKSAEAFADIQSHRYHHIADLALGLVLLRFQLNVGNHLHWEQPGRSLMFRSPLLKEVFEHTWCAQFDLCQIGDLRDPVSKLKIKKSLEVLTTSQVVFKGLHGHVCRKNHEHQTIEGTVRVGDQTIARSKFTENYPRKFARLVALTLRRDLTSSVIRRDECFALSESSRRSKYPRLTLPEVAKVPRTISPSELPEGKRRRMTGKQTVISASQSWHELFVEIDRIVPRVGKRHLDDPSLLKKIQELLPEKTIRFAVACRGTDRALGPIRPVCPGEAPFRKCLFSHRVSGELLIEENWEHWENLSQAKIQRKGQTCRLNITLFASNPDGPVTSESRTDPLHDNFPAAGGSKQVGPMSLNPPELETRRDDAI